MRKLYIVEGIPGSGKTTFARKLAERLREQYPGEKVSLYVEGDLNPADMAWSALLNENEYNQVCEKYASFKDDIKKNTTAWRDYYVVAYTKIDGIPGELFNYFESKEVYDNRVGQELFCQIHEERWRNFGQQTENYQSEDLQFESYQGKKQQEKSLQSTGQVTENSDRNDIYVFECVLLQNAVNELRLFHQVSDEDIERYVTRLLNGVEKLTPTIVYLDVDAKAAIDRAAFERVDEHGSHIWEERVTEYICDSAYGKAQGYHDADGMRRYFAERQRFEKKLLQSLKVESIVLKLDIKAQGQQTEEAIKRVLRQMDIR